MKRIDDNFKMLVTVVAHSKIVTNCNITNITMLPTYGMPLHTCSRYFQSLNWRLSPSETKPSVKMRTIRMFDKTDCIFHNERYIKIFFSMLFLNHYYANQPKNARFWWFDPFWRSFRTFLRRIKLIKIHSRANTSVQNKYA